MRNPPPLGGLLNGGGQGRGWFQFLKDEGKYTLYVFHDVPIGHPNNPDLFLVHQPFGSFLIVKRFFDVNIAIHLDGQFIFHAVEIQDEFSDRGLPTEVMAKDIPAKP